MKAFALDLLLVAAMALVLLAVIPVLLLVTPLLLLAPVPKAAHWNPRTLLPSDPPDARSLAGHPQPRRGW